MRAVQVTLGEVERLEDGDQWVVRNSFPCFLRSSNPRPRYKWHLLWQFPALGTMVAVSVLIVHAQF